MRATTPWQGDVYEIIYDAEGVTSILRFRRGELSHGEEVDYNLMSLDLQHRIYTKLKEAIKDDYRTKENGTK